MDKRARGSEPMQGGPVRGASGSKAGRAAGKAAGKGGKVRVMVYNPNKYAKKVPEEEVTQLQQEMAVLTHALHGGVAEPGAKAPGGPLKQAQDAGLELVSTEKTYLKALKHISHVFVTRLAMKEEMGEAVLMVPEDILTCFQNIEKLYDMHYTFYNDLKSLCSKGPGVAQLFHGLANRIAAFVPCFHMYSQYVNGYEDAMKRLKHLREKDEKLEGFIKFEEAVLEEILGHSINVTSLLITPVQRLARYVLLIKEIVQQGTKAGGTACKAGGPASPEIQQAVVLLEDAAREVYSSFLLKEARDRVVTMDKRLRGLDKFKDRLNGTHSVSKKGRLSLVHESRFHVMDMVVHKKSKHRLQNMHAYNERFLVLFSDVLLYTSPRDKETSTLVVRNLLPLTKMVVGIPERDGKKLKKDAEEKWFHFFVAPDGEVEAQATRFKCSSEAGRDTWITALRERIALTDESATRIATHKSHLSLGASGSLTSSNPGRVTLGAGNKRASMGSIPTSRSQPLAKDSSLHKPKNIRRNKTVTVGPRR